MAGGQYLYGGLSGAGQAIAGAMEKQRTEEKERASRFSKLVSALTTMGVDSKENLLTRSLEDLEGIFEGDKMKRAAGEQALRENELVSRMNMQAIAQAQAIRNMAQQQTYEDTFRQHFAENTASPLGGMRPDADPRQAMVNAAMAAAGATGRVDPNLDNIVRALGDGQGLGDVKFFAAPDGNGYVAQRGSWTSTIGSGQKPTNAMVRPAQDALIQAQRKEQAAMEAWQQGINSAKSNTLASMATAATKARVRAEKKLQELEGSKSAPSPEATGNDSAPAAPYPEGTKLRDKAGNQYIVRNGVPVRL